MNSSSTETAYRGHTRVRQAALISIATALAAEEAEVATDAVKATLHDREGSLGLRISTPLSSTTISECLADPDKSVYQILTQKRHDISQRFEEMTGHKVSTVDLTLTGVKKVEPEGRVQ